MIKAVKRTNVYLIPYDNNEENIQALVERGFARLNDSACLKHLKTMNFLSKGDVVVFNENNSINEIIYGYEFKNRINDFDLEDKKEIENPLDDLPIKDRLIAYINKSENKDEAIKEVRAILTGVKKELD